VVGDLTSVSQCCVWGGVVYVQTRACLVYGAWVCVNLYSCWGRVYAYVYVYIYVGMSVCLYVCMSA